MKTYERDFQAENAEKEERKNVSIDTAAQKEAHMKEQEDCFKASASIILNDVFKVTGIRIGNSQKGNMFVSMSDYKAGWLDDNEKDKYLGYYLSSGKAVPAETV